MAGASAMGDFAGAIGVRLEESAVIAELKAGSEDAYAWLIGEFHQPIYGLIYRLLNDPSDAADTTQEVFLKVFRGMKHFHGESKEGTFGIRVAKELDSPPARMVNSQGAEGEKAIWGKRANWVNYDGKVDGEEVGIAVFDHPKSFRHPTTWHARGYGLFAANPFGLRDFTRDPNQDGSWTIPERKSLTFRYRVIIHHGDYKAANIAEAYQKYAAEP